jgi:hypothetical protein
MREMVFEQLPRQLPSSKKVLVVGPPSHPALGGLRSFISGLNRQGEWIIVEFSDSLPSRIVTASFALVLTMVNTTGSVLANVRSGASRLNIQCPLVAFTTGELRRALARLSESRLTPQKNGHTNAAGILERSAESGSQIVVDEQEVGNPDGTVQPMQTELRTQALPLQNNPSDVTSILERFKPFMEDVQLAVMLVSDENTNLKSRCVQLEQELSIARNKSASLEVSLGQTKTALSSALKAKEKAEEEVDRFRNIMGNLENAIHAVKGR